MSSDDAYQHQHSWENNKLIEAKLLGFRDLLRHMQKEYDAIDLYYVITEFEKYFKLEDHE
jgi:hypothetical protein